MREPIIGEEIYIPSSYHLGRGRDDVDGGKAVINGIDRLEGVPVFNSIFITVYGIKGHSYNWYHLIENQDQLAKEYNGQIAKECPDFRPQFNRF